RTSQFSIKSENTPLLARISQEVTERFYNLLRICGHAPVFHAIFTFSHHPVAAPNIQPVLARADNSDVGADRMVTAGTPRTVAAFVSPANAGVVKIVVIVEVFFNFLSSRRRCNLLLSQGCCADEHDACEQSNPGAKQFHHLKPRFHPIRPRATDGVERSARTSGLPSP